MNKELNYDTHNDSIIRSMSAVPKIESFSLMRFDTTNVLWH